MIVLVHIQPFKNTYFLAFYYFKVLEKYVLGVSGSQIMIQMKCIDLRFSMNLMMGVNSGEQLVFYPLLC